MVPLITYNELYQLSPEKGREKLLSIYKHTGNKMRKTARILNCSVSTVSKWVKRAMNQFSLQNMSRAPKNPKRKIPEKHLIKLKEKRIKTNFGRRRLVHLLKSKYGIIISENTCAYWLRRFKLSNPYKQRARYKGVRYYNCTDLKPLQYFQIHSKDIRDSKTLPKDVYYHLIKEKLPKYQFTAIDVKTRIKFLAYSYSLDRSNGIAFMKLLINWLRVNGVKHTLYFQTDWGKEFGGPSVRTWIKLQKDIFQPRNTFILKIRKRKWIDNAYVERTHRTDDEEFYIPKIKEISNLKDHFELSYGYLAHFNTKRPHYGKYIYSRTPWEMLHNLNPHIPKTICFMPPLILDFVSSSPFFLKEEIEKQFATYKNVRDVFDTYYL